MLSPLFAVLIALTLTFVAVAGPVAAAHPFVDVPPSDPAATAIDQLYTRGVIKGYETTPPTFGPGDRSVRAQMAALIGRAMGWSAGGANPFTDRCSNGSCIDDELWGYVGALASRDVAKGYDPTTYAPFDNVLKQQVILFIARAKVAKGDWVKQPDNGRVYPGSAGSTSDHQDIVTYVFYAGAPPDAPTTYDTAWGDYTGEATRGWFARALWQAYAEGKGPALTEPTVPTSADTAAFIAEVLNLVNAQRQQNSCGPLAANAKLQNAAQKHAVDMAVQDYFEHTGKNGSTPGDRITAEGYAFSTWAENIAAGSSTPQAVMDSWMNSPGHRANILNCNLTEIGIGYYYLANDTGTVNWNHYWVQVFGRPQ